MADFGISAEKKVTLVHDNAADMALCTANLSHDPSWGNVHGVWCAGHTLQLCINAALEQDTISRIIAAARCLEGHFKKSARMSQQDRTP